MWAASGFPGALLKIGLRSLIWGWFKGLRSGIQERETTEVARSQKMRSPVGGVFLRSQKPWAVCLL